MGTLVIFQIRFSGVKEKGHPEKLPYNKEVVSCVSIGFRKLVDKGKERE